MFSVDEQCSPRIEVHVCVSWILIKHYNGDITSGITTKQVNVRSVDNTFNTI